MVEELGPHLTVRRSTDAFVVGCKAPKIVEQQMIEEIGTALGDLVKNESSLKVVLDFSGVNHLSSGALGMLVTLYKDTVARDGSMKISSISPQIAEVFKITRLSKFFDVYENSDQAVASFGLAAD